MKHNIYALIGVMGLVSVVSSCDDTWSPQLDKEGTLQLSDMAVSITDRSRAVDVADYTVSIKKGNAIVQQWKYSEMPEVFTLSVGDGYTVEAYSHEVKKAEWDAPYYLGSKAFKIEENRITNVGTVECVLSNIKVHVTYSDNLKQHMGDDCKVTVMANSDGTLDFGKDETRDGYFEYVSESMTLVATLSGTIDGEKVEGLSQTFSNVTGGMYYDLKFDVNSDFPTPPGFGGDVDTEGIKLNFTVTTKDQDGNINISDSVIDPGKRPDDETPKDPEKPDVPDVPGDEATIKIDSETLNFDSPNDPSDEKISASAIVNIHSDNGLTNLMVHIESNSPEFIASAGDMVPFDFDLADPVVDGKDWSDMLGKLGLGFPVKEEVVGQKDVEFNITQFVPLLAGFPGTHKFTITAIDSKSKESKTLTFVAK